MSTMIRFPYNVETEKFRAELNQIITINPASATFPSAVAIGANLTAWKPSGLKTEAPYTDVVIEFTANAAVLIGNGTTERLGLFGYVESSPTSIYFLLGVLGVNLGTTAPQVPIASALTGFAQVVCNVAAYDGLQVCAINAGNIVTGGPLVTVTARPIRRRNFAG